MPTGTRWNIKVVGICIFLIGKGAKAFQKCLLAVFISSFENTVFNTPFKLFQLFLRISHNIFSLYSIISPNLFRSSTSLNTYLRISIDVIKCHDQQTWLENIHFMMCLQIPAQHWGSSGQELRAETQNQESKQRP